MAEEEAEPAPAPEPVAEAEAPADPTRWAKPKDVSELTLEAAEEAKFLRSPERELVFSVAGRARFVAVASFMVAVLALGVAVVNLLKRADAINVIYMVASAALNAALGMFLLRVSKSIQGVRRAPETPILDAFSQLSKAFVVQIIATGFVALGLIVTLLLALISNRALNQ